MKSYFLLGATVLLAACAGAVPSDVRQFREAPTGLRSREAVSIILLRSSSTDGEPEDYAETLADEAEYFEDCLSEGLEEKGVQVLPSAELSTALRDPLPASE